MPSGYGIFAGSSAFEKDINYSNTYKVGPDKTEHNVKFCLHIKFSALKYPKEGARYG